MKIKSSSEGYLTDRYIHTQAGRFYAHKPTWDVSAIAHALAQKPRYTGNADEQLSIAEHSVLVSMLMEHVTGGSPMEGLFHDGTESVGPDVSSPFKGLFPDLKKMDKGVWEPSLRAALGLPSDKTNQCAMADWLALFIEAAQILPEKGIDFEDPYNFRPQAMDLREQGWRISALDWRTAKAVFLQRYQELGGTL